MELPEEMKNKSIALKAATSVESETINEGTDQDGTVLLAKQFRKFLKSKKAKGGYYKAESNFKNNKSHE